jgi:hypothetical protein
MNSTGLTPINYKIIVLGELKPNADKLLPPSFDFINTTKSFDETHKAQKFIRIHLTAATLRHDSKGRVILSSFKYIYDNIFMDSKPILFHNIVEEIKKRHYEIYWGFLSCNEILLTKLVVCGREYEFPLGFTYNPKLRTPDGKYEPLSVKTLDITTGTYREELAKCNTSKIFLYGDEIYNAENMADQTRQKLKIWEIK